MIAEAIEGPKACGGPVPEVIVWPIPVIVPIYGHVAVDLLYRLRTSFLLLSHVLRLAARRH